MKSTSFAIIIVAISILSVLVAQQQWAKCSSTGNLIGEEIYVTNKLDAIHFANQAIAEGFEIWDEPSSNFQVMYNSSDDPLNDGGVLLKPELLVEAQRIPNGPSKTTGILLTRCTGYIAGSNPDEIYNHLISPEGTQILDETMDPVEAAKYIERYEWKGYGKNAHLDIHEPFNPMPLGIKDRYSMNMDIVDYKRLTGYYTKERFFYCKSIVHDSRRPGSSPYNDSTTTTNKDGLCLSEANINNDERLRVINAFYFHVAADKDRGGTVVKMVNYADFRMGSAVMNWLVGKAFYHPGAYDRLHLKFHMSIYMH